MNSPDLRSTLRRIMPSPLLRIRRALLPEPPSLTCPACGARVQRFMDQGYGHTVLEALQVVGGIFRAADRCPVCQMAARHRLILFYLDRHVLAPAEAGPLRVYHMAPEKGLWRRLVADPRVRYRAGDIDPSLYPFVEATETADLMDLPLADGGIDLFLCSHVLEHVPDDAKAMREIARVLAPEGRAIVQVPLSLKLAETREGDGSESEAERIRRFGQHDHARLYAAEDYVQRWRRAGLEVERYDPFADDPDAAAAMRLDPFERLHVVRRAA